MSLDNRVDTVRDRYVKNQAELALHRAIGVMRSTIPNYYIDISLTKVRKSGGYGKTLPIPKESKAWKFTECGNPTMLLLMTPKQLIEFAQGVKVGESEASRLISLDDKIILAIFHESKPEPPNLSQNEKAEVV